MEATVHHTSQTTNSMFSQPSDPSVIGECSEFSKMSISIDTGTETAQALYKAQEIPGKGTGLIATSEIAAGTRISSEKPFLAIAECDLDRLDDKLAKLPQADRQLFESFHHHPKYKSGRKGDNWTWSLNSLPFEPKLEGKEQPSRGLFLVACRINHSCTPNCHPSWNEEIKRFTIHSIRDIKKGEEITIAYAYHSESFCTRAQRRSWLKRNFVFDCVCEVCSLPDPEIKASDYRRRMILRLQDRFITSYNSGLKGLGPEKELGLCREQIRLLSEEFPNTLKAQMHLAYENALSLTISNGDRGRAIYFVRKLRDMLVAREGEDNPITWDYSAWIKDPSTLTNEKLDTANEVRPAKNYFPILSERWNNYETMPEGLNDEEKEEWLWK